MAIDYYIKNERRDFSIEGLNEGNLPQTPHELFAHWFKEALDQKIVDANAMVLSTVSKDQKPKARVVLMREFTNEGIIFYSNYQSQKAKDIEYNKYVSINFFWAAIDKQVRVEGWAEPISQDHSIDYFNSRPKTSQIGAWVSEQSQIIKDRLVLEDAFTRLSKIYENKTVPKPPHWGGYIIHPERFEFWLGRPSRLHDRVVYELSNSTWKTHRLAP